MRAADEGQEGQGGEGNPRLHGERACWQARNLCWLWAPASRAEAAGPGEQARAGEGRPGAQARAIPPAGAAAACAGELTCNGAWQSDELAGWESLALSAAAALLVVSDPIFLPPQRWGGPPWGVTREGSEGGVTLRPFLPNALERAAVGDAGGRGIVKRGRSSRRGIHSAAPAALRRRRRPALSAGLPLPDCALLLLTSSPQQPAPAQPSARTARTTLSRRATLAPAPLGPLAHSTAPSPAMCTQSAAWPGDCCCAARRSPLTAHRSSARRLVLPPSRYAGHTSSPSVSAHGQQCADQCTHMGMRHWHRRRGCRAAPARCGTVAGHNS